MGVALRRRVGRLVVPLALVLTLLGLGAIPAGATIFE
jgi:hypothetical protein